MKKKVASRQSPVASNRYSAIRNLSRRSVAKADPQSAFSLVELVIVIVIIGIIAAIAVPRFSAATENAGTNADQASVAILQNAIDLFVAEHPTLTLTLTDAQLSEPNSVLTNTTNVTGDPTQSGFGPYLRKIPKRQTGTVLDDSIGDASAAWQFIQDGNQIKLGT